MKYCASCNIWVSGRPAYCPGCGKTWDYRICSRGHLNLINNNYCTQCGSQDLTEASGRERWFSRLAGLKLGKAGKIILGFVVILFISNFSQTFANLVAGFIIAIVLLLFASSFLPEIIRKPLQKSFLHMIKKNNSRG